MYNNTINHTTNKIYELIDDIKERVSYKNCRNINLSFDKNSNEKKFNFKNRHVNITLENRRYNNNIFDEDTDIKSIIKQELNNLNFS